MWLVMGTVVLLPVAFLATTDPPGLAPWAQYGLLAPLLVVIGLMGRTVYKDTKQQRDDAMAEVRRQSDVNQNNIQVLEQTMAANHRFTVALEKLYERLGESH